MIFIRLFNEIFFPFSRLEHLEQKIDELQTKEVNIHLPFMTFSSFEYSSS